MRLKWKAANPAEQVSRKDSPMVQDLFQRVFGSLPEVVVSAPGRVNLIGEHTDYNDGFVLPAAIDRAIAYAGRRRNDRHVRVYSQDFNASVEFDLDDIRQVRENTWSNFLRGVSKFLEADGHRLTGRDIAFGGDVPREAGLSSSAAVEVGAARFGTNFWVWGSTRSTRSSSRGARKTSLWACPAASWTSLSPRLAGATTRCFSIAATSAIVTCRCATT